MDIWVHVNSVSWQSQWHLRVLIVGPYVLYYMANDLSHYLVDLHQVTLNGLSRPHKRPYIDLRSLWPIFHDQVNSVPGVGKYGYISLSLNTISCIRIVLGEMAHSYTSTGPISLLGHLDFIFHNWVILSYLWQYFRRLNNS